MSNNMSCRKPSAAAYGVRSDALSKIWNLRESNMWLGQMNQEMSLDVFGAESAKPVAKQLSKRRPPRKWQVFGPEIFSSSIIT